VVDRVEPEPEAARRDEAVQFRGLPPHTRARRQTHTQQQKPTYEDAQTPKSRIFLAS
jgi:hypothetical protein